MKKFLLRTLLFSLVFLALLEVISRLIVDPVYFNKLNTYNKKVKSITDCYFSENETEHVDFLFIGSSRVPATIDAGVFSRQTGKTAIVAGRGYMNAGMHYQALKNKLKKSPNYLKGAVVFLEYAGSSTFETPFSYDQYFVFESPEFNEAMPHLVLPHIDGGYLKEYLKKSENSNYVKAKLVLLYFSSVYRTIPFIKERLTNMDRPLLESENELLADEGGIRNDIIAVANEKAREHTKMALERSKNTPALTTDDLNSSTLAYLHKLIVENGGKLYLYHMPLHSIQQTVYNTEKEKFNQEVFESWLSYNQIKIIYNKNFMFRDSDFPDTWHLSKERRAEFSSLLLKNFNEQL